MRIPLNQLRKLIREELHSSHRQQFLEQRGRRDRRERRADEEALEDLAAEEGETATTRAAAEQGLAGLESREAERDVEAVEAGRWPESTRRKWGEAISDMFTSDDQNYVERMTTAIQDQPAPTHDDDINWWNNLIGPLNAPEEEGGLALNLPEAGDEDVSAETEVSAKTQVARAEVPAGGLSLGTDGWTPSGYHYYVTDDVIRFVHPTSGKVVTVSEESNKKAWDAILGNVDGANEAYVAAVAAHTGAAAGEGGDEGGDEGGTASYPRPDGVPDTAQSVEVGEGEVFWYSDTGPGGARYYYDIAGTLLQTDVEFSQSTLRAEIDAAILQAGLESGDVPVSLEEQRCQGKLIAERWQRLAGMKVL